MKTLQFLCVLLFCLISISLSAQLRYTLGAGIQLSNLSGDNDFQNVTVFHSDFKIGKKSNKRFQMEYGFSFNQKGAIKDERRSSMTTYIRKTAVSLVELPIQANLFFTSPNAGMYALASLRPTFAVHFQSNHRYFDAENSLIHSRKYGSTRNLATKSSNVNSRLGIGYELPTLSAINFFAEVFAEAQLLGNFKSGLYAKNSFYYGIGTLLGIRF